MRAQKSVCRQAMARRLRACLPFALAGALFLFVCLLGSEALACPTCSEGLAESDPAGQAMAAGYFYSILFMMSMPFLILGTFGSCVYWSIHRGREQQTDPKRSVSPCQVQDNIGLRQKRGHN